jgi:dTDP-glucose 4,6-dehydratase
VGTDIDENSPLQPFSPYAATKLAADHLVLSYVRTYKVKATIIRMFNAYGPGQHFEKVIPMFICSVLCGLPLPIQGNGNAVRDLTYVADVCLRLERLLGLTLPFVVCNTGSGNALSVLELAQRISNLAGISDPEIVKFPERPGHVSHQMANVGKANEYLGQAETPLDQGLGLTFDWYRHNIARWRDNFLEARTTLLDEMRKTGGPA